MYISAHDNDDAYDDKISQGVMSDEMLKSVGEWEDWVNEGNHV